MEHHTKGASLPLNINDEILFWIPRIVSLFLYYLFLSVQPELDQTATKTKDVSDHWISEGETQVTKKQHPMQNKHGAGKEYL